MSSPEAYRHLNRLARPLVKEIEEARIIQRAMLPVEPLRPPPVELACKCRPAAEVGGDFSDYYWMLDHRLGFFLGDVVGKGLPAALYAALAVGILRGIKKGGEGPVSVLQMLNRRLLDRQVPGRYCAVQYAVFDPPSRELRFANAGLQPRPVHVSAGGSRELGGGGLPCGLFRDAQYELYSVALAAGDLVLFSTDGVIESRNPAGEEFGIERLMRVCVDNRREPCGVFLDRVFGALDGFTEGMPQQDDVTAAVLKIA
jgi:sigma-B regulation protein RsbU (phosphoserine phosphatase)